PAPDEVVAWLKADAVPIATTDPESTSNDLTPLMDALRAARILAIGEGTLGSREFSRLKQRLIQRLVADGDVTVVALEANFAEAELVDAYVGTQGGWVDTILNSQFQVLQTHEVRELIEWIRRWNAEPAHRRKVRLRGFDMQSPRRSIAAVEAYLRKVDPA